MWFKRKYNEYGCPMCGRLPVIKASQTEKYHESRKVRTTLTVYRLQCPRGHISTSYVQSYNDLSYRRRPASEILWAMVKANGKRTN